MTHAPITTIPRKKPVPDQARDRALEALAQMYGYFEPGAPVPAETSADYDRQAA